MTQKPREPYLLTPGPLTTSMVTKEAMLVDWGSWDEDFKAVTARMRARLLAIAGGGEAYTCVPVQGSGTFVVEAVLNTTIPREGSRTLVLMNGAYGKRIAKTLAVSGRAYVSLDTGDYLPPDPADVDALLKNDPTISHVALVHCETSSGILNPVVAIAQVVKAHGRRLFVDSMSAFGALPLDAREIPYDSMVSSANKCIEGVPGFGFAIVRRDVLEASAGNSTSLSLDLHDQWATMEKTGQWRFTPPTHVVIAFDKALDQFDAEGGQPGRGARYEANHRVLVDGMRALGFETLLPDRWQSPIITTFHCPNDPAFNFKVFYDQIKARGFIIYPGKLTEVETFRIGCIGQLFEIQMKGVVNAIGESLDAMGVKNAAPAPGVAEDARATLV